MPFVSQAIDRAAIFRCSSPQRPCTHRVNGTVNVDKLAILDMTTFALNWVEYLGSGFAHLLPDVSGTGQVFVPSLTLQSTVKKMKMLQLAGEVDK